MNLLEQVKLFLQLVFRAAEVSSLLDPITPAFFFFFYLFYLPKMNECSFFVADSKVTFQSSKFKLFGRRVVKKTFRQ